MSSNGKVKDGGEVTLVFISNDGNEALACCKENDEVVIFPRPLSPANEQHDSQQAFRQSLPVGLEMVWLGGWDQVMKHVQEVTTHNRMLGANGFS